MAEPRPIPSICQRPRCQHRADNYVRIGDSRVYLCEECTPKNADKIIPLDPKRAIYEAGNRKFA